MSCSRQWPLSISMRPVASMSLPMLFRSNRSLRALLHTLKPTQLLVPVLC